MNRYCFPCLAGLVVLLGATVLLAEGSGSLVASSKMKRLVRVVIAQDPKATREFQPVPSRVQTMVERGITNLTGRTSASAAWRSLVSTQDVVGIKVYSLPGPNIGTRPAVVEAVVKGLKEAGVRPYNIIIWDKHIEDLRSAGYEELAQKLGVRLSSSLEAGWDAETSYDNPILGMLVYGDRDFGKKNSDGLLGRKSYVSRLVSRDITRHIIISPLLNHNLAGVTGNLYSLGFGSVDNTLRFESEFGRMVQAVPEIFALPVVGDRVALCIVDALISQYEGEQVGRLHYSSHLNQIRFSYDPVALDVLSIRELVRQREQQGYMGQHNTNVLSLYQNATILEIGVSDPQLMQVEWVK